MEKSVQNFRTFTVNPNQIPQNAVSDQGLHCFPLAQQFLHTKGSKRVLFNYRTIWYIKKV